jgi:glycosyltransferase involved in cell wall biosynthesis
VVVSSPLTVQAFLQSHLRALAKVAQVTVVADSSDGRFLLPVSRALKFQRIPIRRAIDPVMDLVSLASLAGFFRAERFDLVHSYTPKAGLLAMVAAFFCGVPSRVHTFTGQVWATRKGFARWLLKTLDRLTALLATHILVDSPSQLRFLRSEGVLRPRQGNVLGAGSVSGVDLRRFRPDLALRKKIRAALGFSKDTVAFLYLGRLNRDKGIPELYQAFEQIRSEIPNASLLMVGPEEEKIPLPKSLAVPDRAVIHAGPTNRPEKFMAAADVFVLPSHREGFGSTVIEAAACGVPAVASRIYGLTDAVVHGHTGLLVKKGDPADLGRALTKLGRDPRLRQRLGSAARLRAARRFDQKLSTRELLLFYRKTLPRP